MSMEATMEATKRPAPAEGQLWKGNGPWSNHNGGKPFAIGKKRGNYWSCLCAGCGGTGGWSTALTDGTLLFAGWAPGYGPQPPQRTCPVCEWAESDCTCKVAKLACYRCEDPRTIAEINLCQRCNDHLTATTRYTMRKYGIRIPMEPPRWEDHLAAEATICARMKADGHHKPLPPAEAKPGPWVCQVLEEDLLPDAGSSYKAPR